MGLEIISQPQLFLRPLTALNGVEGYVPPYTTTFFTWTTSSSVSSYTFPLTGNIGLGTSNRSESYIVNIDGVVQPPPSYYVDPDFRRISFVNPIPANAKIFITQLGTIALTSARFVNLTGINVLATNLSATTISAQYLKVDNKITDPLVVSALSADSLVIDTSIDSPALRVTQRGNGDVIRVEDSNNPDTTPLIVKNDGNVGIGTANPIAKLDVVGDIQLPNRSGIYARDTSSNVVPVLQTWNDNNVYLSSPGDLIFRTNGTTQKARLSSDGTFAVVGDTNIGGTTTVAGNLGVGTTDPKARVHIIQTVDTQYPLLVEDSANPDATPFVITSAGDVGMGIRDPKGKLHIYAGGSTNKIIQQSNDTSSPKIVHYLTDQNINTSSGYEIYDPGHPYVDENLALSLDFDKRLPVRPVNYWLTQKDVDSDVFDLVGGPTVETSTPTTNPGAYVVAVGGLIQPYNVYTIDGTTRRITFTTQNVPRNTSVYVLQLVNPALAGMYDMPRPVTSLTASNLTVSTFALTGLTAGDYFRTYGSNNYIVSIEGITQMPSNPPYQVTAATVAPRLTSITFSQPIPAGLRITTTKIPSAINPDNAFEETCYLTPLYTWTRTTTTWTTGIELQGGPNWISTDRACYLVNIGGVLQVPTSYTLNARTRTIRFADLVPGGVQIAATMLSVPEFPIEYSTRLKIVDDCYNSSSGVREDVLVARPGVVQSFGGISTAPPIRYTNPGAVGASTTAVLPFSASSIIWSPNGVGALSVRLPNPGRFPGRWLHFKKLSTLSSAITSIIPNVVVGFSDDNSVPTSIIIAAQGAPRWAHLQSNGERWVVMAQGGA